MNPKLPSYPGKITATISGVCSTTCDKKDACPNDGEKETGVGTVEHNFSAGVDEKTGGFYKVPEKDLDAPSDKKIMATQEAIKNGIEQCGENCTFTPADDEPKYKYTYK